MKGNTMDDQDIDLNEFLGEMLATIETTFHEFLADPTSPFDKDAPVARVGFYTAMLDAMREDPIEDDEEGVQDALEQAIEKMRDTAQTELEQQIHQIVQAIYPI